MSYPPTAPTPVVVNTVPAYLGGHPTPPPSPRRVHAVLAVDDHAPCPPTPLSVLSSAFEWPEAVDSGTSQSTLFPQSSPSSELEWILESGTSQSTSPQWSPRVSVFDDFDDQDQCDITPQSHVSDSLVYDNENYAYPSPILTMITRAKVDQYGLGIQPVDPWSCQRPFRMFSLTAGHIPVTGLEQHDEATFDFYTLLLSVTPRENPESSLSYFFPIDTIQAIQHELGVHMHWRGVYPEPIPPVIIHLRDLIGPYNLAQRRDASAFVVPTEGSIWTTICDRGIDWNYRPLNSALTVDTTISRKGAAFYYPQHTVASQFTVNVFLQLPAPAETVCEYLGAFVLRTVDGLTISADDWANLDPAVQRSVLDRDSRFEEQPWPQLPCVEFLYYKWDTCMVGFVDGYHNRNQLACTRVPAKCEEDILNIDLQLDFFDLVSTPIDTPTASPSPEPDYTSFLDLSQCE